LIKAIEINGVDGAGFQMVMLPVIIDKAKFQKYTAHGKLKAEMTPTIPSGFHYSRI
jgi:hypothetical protein